MKNEKYNQVKVELLSNLNVATIAPQDFIELVSRAVKDANELGAVDLSIQFETVIFSQLVYLVYYTPKTEEQMAADVLQSATTVEARKATYDALCLEFGPEAKKV
jgi:hypothetical protein